MYYLSIDIQHFSQFAIVEPDASAALLKDLHGHCSRYGMKPYPGSDGLLFYHPNLGAGEYAPLLKVMFALESRLKDFDEDIPGFSIILEALENSEPSLHDIIGLRLSIRERVGMYLGPNAEKLISRFLIGESFRGLWKILARKRKDDENLGTASEFVLRREFTESVFNAIEPWMNGEAPPGVVCISGQEMDGVHLAARGLIHRLSSTEALGRIPFILISERQDFLFSLMQAVLIQQSLWVPEYLCEWESAVWTMKRDCLTRFHSRATDRGMRNELLPESADSDTLVAFSLYLKAYARWSRENGNLPMVAVHLERGLSDWEQQYFVRLMQDKDSRLVWLFSGEHEYLEIKDLPLARADFTLNRYTEHDIQQLLDRQEDQRPGANPGYLHSSAGGCALPIYFFLSDYEYFAQILPSRLRNYGNSSIESQEGIVQRFIDRLEFETRELLYTLALAGDFLDKEQLFRFMEVRGRLRIRITQMYKDLQSRGLLLFEQLNHVPFRDIILRMAYALGDVRTSIITQLVEYMCDDASDFQAHPGALIFVGKYGRTAGQLIWCYRKIQDMIDSSNIDLAQGLVAKLPSLPQSKKAEELLGYHIALHEGTSGPAPINPEKFENGFWYAESLLIAARQMLNQGDIDQARLMAKRAIIEYQQLDDRRGLAASNILFGFLLLKNGKHQDASHYFSIAERSQSRFNLSRIQSIMLPCLSDFTQGKYSRVRQLLEGSDGLISVLYRYGSRSWSAAASFILARCYFAMGLFSESYELLSREMNTLQGERLRNVRRIFYSWMARNLVYTKNLEAGLALLENQPNSGEAMVFLAEAMILANRYEEALEILSNPVSHSKHSLSIGQLLPWGSGFSWLEDLYINDVEEQGVLSNYAYGLWCFALGNLGSFEQSIEGFHWLTREKKLPESDPHISVILYWYSLIIEKANDSENEDRLTLLGRAVKALQERSSRIEEPADKREYLKNVVWNRELLEKAKRFNLV